MVYTYNQDGSEPSSRRIWRARLRRERFAATIDGPAPMARLNGPVDRRAYDKPALPGNASISGANLLLGLLSAAARQPVLLGE